MMRIRFTIGDSPIWHEIQIDKYVLSKQQFRDEHDLAHIIKNEQDNIAKSAAISVYESSPLSYVEKGKDLEIKKGDVFKINFNLGDDEK